MAYDRLDPISTGFRIDVSGALIAAVIANTNRDPKQRKEPWTPADFLIAWDSESEAATRKEPTAEDLLLKAQFFAALGMGVIEEGG